MVKIVEPSVEIITDVNGEKILKSVTHLFQKSITNPEIRTYILVWFWRYFLCFPRFAPFGGSGGG